MPAKISKNSDGTYNVHTPNGVHAKGTTLAKAQAQQRLLNAVDHGWRPGKKRKRSKTMMG
jgi:hypothetical protein